jgi:hypothetical protein
MNCPKCGTEIIDVSGKCPNCWTKTSSSKERPVRPKYFKPMVAAMIALAVLGIAALVVASVLSSRQTDVTYAPSLPIIPGSSVIGSDQNQNPQGNVIGAVPPDQSGGSVMQAPEPNPLPSQENPGYTKKPKPPQYVIDYLNFVKSVEEHRQKLLKDTQNAFAIGAANKASGGLDALLNMLDDEGTAQAKDPLQDTKDELSRQYTNWNNILAFFNNRQPPQECKEFAAYYQQVLYNETGSIGQIITTLSAGGDYDKNSVTQVVVGLQGILKGGAQKSIDTSVEYADTSLTNLVSNYDMEKPFTVSKEQGSGGSILGF